VPARPAPTPQGPKGKAAKADPKAPKEKKPPRTGPKKPVVSKASRLKSRDDLH
jgi:ribosome maturation factor RimP